MSSVLSLSHLGPEQKAEFQRLTRAPRLSVITTGLCVLLVVTYLGSYTLAGTGVIPLWAGMLLNTLVGYTAFSVGHDAIHRSISSNTRLNDAIGQIALTLILPYVDMRMFRWAHVAYSGEVDR
jgi:fatty acid desaturase